MGESHYLHLLCVIGWIYGGGSGGAGLYPWTLGSQHEWSCAVGVREGKDCGYIDETERSVGVSLDKEVTCICFKNIRKCILLT